MSTVKKDLWRNITQEELNYNTETFKFYYSYYIFFCLDWVAIFQSLIFFKKILKNICKGLQKVLYLLQKKIRNTKVLLAITLNGLVFGGDKKRKPTKKNNLKEN